MLEQGGVSGAINRPLAEASANWWEKLKALVDFEQLKNKIQASDISFVEVATYFAIGFLSGFFFSRYARYLVFSILLFSIVFILLDNVGLINVDWDRLRMIFDFQGAETVDGIFGSYLNWVKANVVTVISLLIGFVLGYKVG